MKLQDLTKDHIEILDNWTEKSVKEEFQMFQEILAVWNDFHELSREEKDRLWDTCS